MTLAWHHDPDRPVRSWEDADQQLQDAAAEIARLRLTDAERYVLCEVRDIYADEDDVKCNEIAAVIEGLLERHTQGGAT